MKKSTILDIVKQNGFRVAVVVWAIVLTYAIVSMSHVCATPDPIIVYETVTEYVEVETGLEPYYRSISDTMTEADYHLLAKILQLEAGNQSPTGQRAVVEVVFNRVLDQRFPDTVSEVLSQPGQFSTYKNIHKANPGQEQYDAIDATLLTTEPVLLPEVIYFAPGNMNRPLYERIGGHNFYLG